MGGRFDNQTWILDALTGAGGWIGGQSQNRIAKQTWMRNGSWAAGESGLLGGSYLNVARPSF